MYVTTRPISWEDDGCTPSRSGIALWNFSEAQRKGDMPWDNIGNSLTALHRRPSPWSEFRRAELVVKLRERYAESCKELLGFERPPADSIDRWLLEQLAQPKSQNCISGDPLLQKPSIGLCSRVLIRELLAEVPLRWSPSMRMMGKQALGALRRYRESASEWVRRLAGEEKPDRFGWAREEINKLDSFLGEHEDAATVAGQCPFRQRLQELSGEGGFSERLRLEVEPIAMRVVEHISAEAEARVGELQRFGDGPAAQSTPVCMEEVGNAIVLKFVDCDTIRVSRLHYEKLRALYERLCPCPTVCTIERGAWNDEFLCRLYVMLRRYITFIGLDPLKDGLVGGNMHAAAPEKVFDWLRQNLDVRCELFASPLNCYFARYCSAFLDVDEPFGSLGSFFDADFALEGSYEVGPPYTEEVLMLTAKRLLWLLRCGRPLSFVLFVPDWPGAGALELLDGPDFKGLRRSWCRDEFGLAAGRDHEYVSGIQFFADAGENASRRYYIVPHGTRVYVLQNDAGHERWPFTKEKERELMERLRP